MKLIRLFVWFGVFVANAYASTPATIEAARERAAELRVQIAHHDELYFKKSAPEITDAEYDKLKRELAALEKDYPALANGATNPGDDRSGGFPGYTHRVRMLSLEKSYTEAELKAFVAKVRRQIGRDDVTFVVEPKFDGLAISVTYEHGKLMRAVTRGNGVEGDDVTANFLALCDVPRELKATPPIPDLIELRGEVYMSYAEFKRINAEREAAGEEPFAHPRNLAAGTLKQTAPADRSRRLEVVFYGWGAVEPASLAPESQQALHARIRAWGLPGVADFRVMHTEDEAWRAVQEFGAMRPKLPFPTDGAVVKLDDASLRAPLGETEEAPRWAIAYKFPPDQVSTRVTAIVLQVGRTGVLTPVAEFEPVKIGGSTIRRASLHNRNEIDRLDVRVGDYVFVEKAGEIIPAITGVDRARRRAEIQPFVFPESCPSCATTLLNEPGEAATRCPNQDCPAQLQRRLEYFVSDSCVNIDGLGSAAIAKLVELHLVNEPADLYHLLPEQLARAAGEKNAGKIHEAITRSKRREPWRFVMGLGIPKIGSGAAKTLAKRFPSLDALSVAKEGDLSGLNESALRSLLAYLEQPGNRDAVKRLHAAIAAD